MVSAIGRVVVVDRDATVVLVGADPSGSVVVVVSRTAADVVVGAEDGTVLGALSEAQAPATSTTTIGMTDRSLTSVGLDNAGSLGGLIGLAGHATALRLIDAGQQVDAKDEEDNQPKHGRP